MAGQFEDPGKVLPQMTAVLQPFELGMFQVWVASPLNGMWQPTLLLVVVSVERLPVGEEVDGLIHSKLFEGRMS